MLKSLLMGLDGSTNSHAVLELGLRWAKRFDALVVGMGIVDEQTLCTSGASRFGGSLYWPQAARIQLEYHARHRADQVVEEFACRCAEEGVKARTLEDMGAPYLQILAEARSHDLILLGRPSWFDSRGLSGLGLDPVEAETTLCRILQASPCPVVAVPRTPTGGESIVVAYDGSPQAAHALDAFLASGLGGTQLVHVVNVSPDSQDAVRHAERAVGALRLQGVQAVPHQVVTAVPPAEVILNKLCYLEAGLLVMGAGKRSGEGDVDAAEAAVDFELGSVTRAVLKASPVPIFCYH